MTVDARITTRGPAPATRAAITDREHAGSCIRSRETPEILTPTVERA